MMYPSPTEVPLIPYPNAYQSAFGKPSNGVLPGIVELPSRWMTFHTSTEMERWSLSTACRQYLAT